MVAAVAWTTLFLAAPALLLTVAATDLFFAAATGFGGAFVFALAVVLGLSVADEGRCCLTSARRPALTAKAAIANARPTLNPPKPDLMLLTLAASARLCAGKSTGTRRSTPLDGCREELDNIQPLPPHPCPFTIGTDSFLQHPFTMPAIQSPEHESIQPEEVHPDVALVARAKDGDTSAFEQLVRQYDRQIFRVAQHITQNREDAEDITQDVFFKAYQKLEQFQGNSKFSTWLVRIAVNESLMRLRKRKTSKTVSMDEDVHTEEGSIPRDFAEWRPNPEQLYGQSELSQILRKTIQGLPPGFRTVFTLRDVENLSTEETAEALGLSVPAVKSRLLRARLQLRERLSRYFKQNPLQALESKTR